MTGITDHFLFAIGAVLLVYELVIWGMAHFMDKKYNGALISPRVLAASRKNPIIPFAVGVLFGHWYW